MRVNYYDFDNRDAMQRSIGSTLNYQINTAHQFKLGLSYLNSDARNNMYSYTKPTLHASLNRYWRGGFITNLRYVSSRSNYENKDLFFGQSRDDKESQFELSVMNQRLNILGLAPKIHLGRIKHSSTIDYYSWRRNYSKLSLTRVF